ncbi:MAG: hypothetical protein AAF567_02065 [Actinomycetota bacterium]
MSIASERRLDVGLNLQRKAAIVAAGAVDHAGRVRVARMTDFDMGRTIFGGLEGAVPRAFMEDKLGKDVFWGDPAITAIEADYATVADANPVPTIDQRLIDFMVDECDFSMEHADGTFLEHLVFCHDYAARYYPEHSPNIALLHSILGTATNTFAMEATKIDALETLLTEAEARHVSAFPSLLRLLYDAELVPSLEENLHRLDSLKSIRFHRVIDNEPLSLTAEELWVNLNFHLMHFVDFMPAANWGTHRADPLMQMFETLSNLLDRAGQRQARVEVAFPEGSAKPIGEARTIVGRVSGLLPPEITLKLARKSIREYSELAGHDLGFELVWAS